MLRELLHPNGLAKTKIRAELSTWLSINERINVSGDLQQEKQPGKWVKIVMIRRAIVAIVNAKLFNVSRRWFGWLIRSIGKNTLNLIERKSKLCTQTLNCLTKPMISVVFSFDRSRLNAKYKRRQRRETCF